MKNLLKVFALLIEFGPQKILEAIDEKDLLTGWYNSSGFLAKVEEERKRRGVFSLIYLEIDNFHYFVMTRKKKEVDQMISDFVRAIKINAPHTIGRWDVDNFAILLPQMPYEEALRTARKMKISNVTFSVSTFGEKGNVIDLFGTEKKGLCRKR